MDVCASANNGKSKTRYADRVSLFEKRLVTVDGIETIYRVYAPRDAEGPLPAILFLHGAGESGSDGLLQTTVGIGPAIERAPERFPALVVFPQASRGYGWRAFNLAAAEAALDDVAASYPVDQSRVSVTGISMGGYGTWLLALQRPERFAAAVPVCGGLDRAARMTYAQAAQRLASMPQWAFHGDRDDIIPPDESRLMVRALEAAGAPVRYTEYPGVRHNSWDRAYAEPELMPWLLRAVRP
jgi:predicted peptidase